jgi:hypothetical protein
MTDDPRQLKLPAKWLPTYAEPFNPAPARRKTRTITAHGRTFEVRTLDTGPDAPARKPRGARRRFTQIPRLWEVTLGKARASGSTYAVAIVLIYEATMLKLKNREPVVSLTTELLRPVGIGERGKRNAVRQLSALKLIDFTQLPGRNPVVTVYFLD